MFFSYQYLWGYSTKFHMGGLQAEIQLLTLVIKGSPFIHLSLKKGAPFNTYFRTLHPFSKPLE